MFTEKQLEVLFVNDLGPRSKMTLTFNTRISSLTQLFSGHRLQYFLKNPLFPKEKPKLQNLILP